MKELSTYGLMLRVLILAYVQYASNAERITKRSKSATILFVYQDYLSAIGMNCTQNCGYEFLTISLHYK